MNTQIIFIDDIGVQVVGPQCHIFSIDFLKNNLCSFFRAKPLDDIKKNIKGHLLAPVHTSWVWSAAVNKLLIWTPLRDFL